MRHSQRERLTTAREHIQRALNVLMEYAGERDANEYLCTENSCQISTSISACRYARDTVGTILSHNEHTYISDYVCSAEDRA